MNIKNFSLDYIQPSGAAQAVPATDPWVDAVNYYGPPILRTLQEGGHKRVHELFERTKVDLNVPDLQLEQFVGVVDRMILNRQITVVQTGESSGEAIVALPVPVSAG
jgi:hypothetical protein